MSFNQGRNIIFTCNNPPGELNPDWWPDETKEKIKFVVWQHEIGESGTFHIQGYMELTTQMRRAAIQAIDGFEGAHLEVRGGTKAQAVEYVTKEETRVEGPWYWPSKEAVMDGIRGQGQRSDLKRFAEQILAGVPDRELALSDPVTFLKFGRHGTNLRNAVQQGVRSYLDPVEVHFIIGPTGTGKSHHLATHYPEGGENYWANPGKGQWFDGYQGQTTIVFDEMRDSWYPWAFLLKLWDHNPMRAETKGGFLQIKATRFIVTTNVHPKKWYKGVEQQRDWTKSPLRRRITRWTYMLEPFVDESQLPVDEELYIGDEEAGAPIQFVDGIPWFGGQRHQPPASENIATLEDLSQAAINVDVDDSPVLLYEPGEDDGEGRWRAHIN